MFDLLLVFLLGTLLGILTGLIPGLHPNTLIFLLLPLAVIMDGVTMFIAFVTGMSIVHTFVSFIPSVLLGAPEGDTALSVLPGHRYLQRGRGIEAIQLTVYGGVIAATLALLSLPLLFHIIPAVYNTITGYLHLLLALVLAAILWQSDDRWNSVLVMGLSGLLGVIVLDAAIANTQYILFPLFAGLFGISTILIAIWQHSPLPPQGNNRPVTLNTALNGGILGVAAGLLAGFLPGLGASQSAFIVRRLSGLARHDFIVALGGINTADLFFSLVALYLIGNPRSGTAVAIQHVVPAVTLHLVVLVTGLALIAVGIGAVTTLWLSQYAVEAIERINYRRLLFGVIGFIAAGTVILTGLFGLLVLGTAAALGITATTRNVRKSYCMAALIVPTIIQYATM